MKNRRKQRMCCRSDRIRIDRVRFFPQCIGVVLLHPRRYYQTDVVTNPGITIVQASDE